MAVSTEFAQTLHHLRHSAQPLPARDLARFSDLSAADLAALREVWPGLPAERRRALAEDLSEFFDRNYEVDFNPVFVMLLGDDDEGVRATASEALWEADDPKLARPLLDLLRDDPFPTVRAAAAQTLGRFVFLGEVDKLPAALTRQVESALLAVWHGGDDVEVRRRALESLAYSSRVDVAPLIEEAFDSDDPPLRASALFAMGRTADDETWSRLVLDEIHSDIPEVRYEAIRAAGELELTEAVQVIIATLETEKDNQVREAAIWSLGQIGAPEARRALEALLETAADDEEQEFIQEALELAALHDDLGDFDLFAYDPDEDEVHEWRADPDPQPRRQPKA